MCSLLCAHTIECLFVCSPVFSYVRTKIVGRWVWPTSVQIFSRTNESEMLHESLGLMNRCVYSNTN